MTEEPTKEELEQHIDFLHDRIQFLEEELEDSEKTVLELRQQGHRLEDEQPETVLLIDDTEDAIKEAHDRVRDTLAKMQDKLDKLPDCENTRTSESWEERRERKRQEMADKVSQYESPSHTGSSPGDHI